MHTFLLSPRMKTKFYSMTLTLGEHYMVKARGNWRMCKFVKVTRKGFNLLDVETARCIVHGRHLYAPKMSGKAIPPGIATFKFNIPEYIEIADKVQMKNIC